ncbi:hypothetical protein NUACC21_69240 [Scytonema sp. NUACC21]
MTSVSSASSTGIPKEAKEAYENSKKDTKKIEEQYKDNKNLTKDKLIREDKAIEKAAPGGTLVKTKLTTLGSTEKELGLARAYYANENRQVWVVEKEHLDGFLAPGGKYKKAKVYSLIDAETGVTMGIAVKSNRDDFSHNMEAPTPVNPEPPKPGI